MRAPPSSSEISPKKSPLPRGLEHDALAGVVLEEDLDLARAHDVQRIARIAVVEQRRARPACSPCRRVRPARRVPARPAAEERHFRQDFRIGAHGGSDYRTYWPGVSHTASAAAFDAVASRYDDSSRRRTPIRSSRRSAARVHARVRSPLPRPAPAAGDRLRHRRRHAGADRPRPRHRRLRSGARHAGEAARKLAAAGRATKAAFRPGRRRRHGGVVAVAGGGRRRRVLELRAAQLRAVAGAAAQPAGPGAAPGGRFVAVVLPRWSPLEIACFLAAGRAANRAAPLSAARPSPTSKGRRSPIRYYGPADFDRALGPGYRRIETRSLGLLLPPPRFAATALRVPGLWRLLLAAEDRLSALPGVRNVGDHVLVAYERARDRVRADELRRPAARRLRASAAPDPGACRRARASP